MTLSLLRSIDKYFATGMRWILIFFMTAIPLICGVEVMFRYVLRRPLHGSDEILILLQVWLYFIGVVSAARERSHITARVLEAALKTNEAIARLRMFDATVAACVAGYFVSMGWDYFAYAWRVSKTTTILRYPMIWYEVAPLVCFVPLLLYTVAEVFYYAKRAKHSDIDFLSQNEEIDEYLTEIAEVEKDVREDGEN